MVMTEKENLKEATFGAGCFWCTEAVFDMIEGVAYSEPGYAGGHIKNPAYREVCNGTTGHAEVIRVHYDPQAVSYETLLEVFFATHDPTTLNRQGADVGTQYRSVIFFHDAEQERLANLAKKAADQSGVWPGPVVTAVEPLTTYYTAERDHHDYFAQHGDQPYCAAVIRPKTEKFRALFSHLLKKEVQP